MQGLGGIKEYISIVSVRQVCLQQNAFQTGDKNILPRFFFNICDIQNIPLKQLRKFPQSYSFLMATPWF